MKRIISFLAVLLSLTALGQEVKYFTVVTEGVTGQKWIERLEFEGVKLSERAKQILLSDLFVPTSGRVVNLALLTSKSLQDRRRTVYEAYDYAEANGLGEVQDIEVACMVAERFSKDNLKALGLSSIVVTHVPLFDFEEDDKFLLHFKTEPERTMGNISYYEPRELDKEVGFLFEKK